ncbi:hypothetical protein BBF96_04525 [Anoxybacter fermentans]|uniref:Fatty acid-binding protein DegV n=1 Tax=Anoxybacter fermentans TaxID=1323375 RepID=A0A3Q9HPF9_9FIRM|nr:DegV family protein [Anoxybacter fermentans]AZR72719.1 hypothetical protein BBF96_04525 [Anoxybacter fermentans]
MAIRIVTDSTSDLPKEILEKYDISVVPLTVEIDGKVFRDGDLKGKEFFDFMDKSENLPKTSAPSPKAFSEVFKKFSTKDEIVCITLSSKVSSTCQSARLGAELTGRKIWLIDSKAASLGLGILAIYAAEMAKLGKGIQEIIKEINRRIDEMHILAFLDTAKNIVKCGRLSKAAGSLVNMLNIKILLTNNEGEIEFLTKMRGKKRTFRRLLQIIEEYSYNLENKIVGITHGDNLPDAEILKDLILEKFNPREVILNYMGSCIGTHIGRGGLTINF